jgi:hypothetical protein
MPKCHQKFYSKWKMCAHTLTHGIMGKEDRKSKKSEFDKCACMHVWKYHRETPLYKQ